MIIRPYTISSSRSSSVVATLVLLSFMSVFDDGADQSMRRERRKMTPGTIAIIGVSIVILAVVAPLLLIWLYNLLFTGTADWTSVHARLLPFGSAIATYLAAKLFGNGHWLFWRDWGAIMEAAGLGVIIHGIFAVLVLEGGVKLALYVIQKWREERERIRKEVRKEVRKEERDRIHGIIAQYGTTDPSTGVTTVSAEGMRLLNQPDGATIPTQPVV